MSPVRKSSTSRHACHCGKSFVRKEHLTRHQVTHNRQPAHICQVCSRRFSRKELLRRHSAVHDPNHVRIVVSCDACRANKTKCSGGAQCSLCMRRGIRCSFENAPGRAIVPPSAEDGSGDVSAIEEDDGPALPAASNSEHATGTPRKRIGRELLSLEEFQDLSIVASLPILTNTSQMFGSGMRAIENILLITETSSLESVIAPESDMRQWLSRCEAAYFQSFHLRWPVLNAPSFDARMASLHVSAIICVFGVWFGTFSDREERSCALRVHNILLQHLLNQIMELDLMANEQPWPLELFQAILLVLIFSLCRTDKRAASRAMLLRSTFITRLREIRAFDAEVLAEQLGTHFSGPFEPFTLSMREQFRRLLALTYKLDVYVALLQDQPPILHRQEINVCLTTTYATWNSHGLDVLARRLRDEPAGRDEYHVSTMTDGPAFAPLLIKDIHLGLCGTLQTIWALTPSSPHTANTSHGAGASRQTIINKALDVWKNELDRLRKLIDSSTSGDDAARYLLLAYRGEDDSTSASLGRISTLIDDAMVLYYTLKMHQYAGLHDSEFVSVKTSQSRSAGNPQITQIGREALGGALQVLAIARATPISSGAVFVNSLFRHALLRGSVLTTRVLNLSQRCECSNQREQGLVRGSGNDINMWIERGGSLSIYGTLMCFCQLEVWTERFEEAIRAQGTIAEEVEGFAPL